MEMRSRPTTESKLRAVGVGAGVAVAGFALGIVLGIAVLVALWSVLRRDLTAIELLVVNFVTLQGLAFPIVSWAYLRIRGLPLSFVRGRLPTWTDLTWTVGSYVGAFVLATVAVILVASLGAPAASNSAGETAVQNPTFALIGIPVSLLIVGPGEELLFRGVIQGTLREQFDIWPAIVLASAMFAPAHILALSGSLLGMLVTISVLFVPSLVFGYAYEQTGNIVVPALAHGAYNATLFGLIYISSQVQPQGAAAIAPF